MEKPEQKIEHFESIRESEDEFYDAVESFENSPDKVQIFRPALKDFSPINKLYSSEKCFKTSDFSSFGTLFPNQSIKFKSIREWSSKKSLKKNNKDYFEFNTLSLIQEFPIAQTSNLLFDFSPDGRFLIISGTNPHIFMHEFCRQTFPEEDQSLIYDQPVHTYSAHTSQVTSVSWLSSSLYFLTGSSDGMVYKWTIGDSSPIGVFKHSTEVVFISVYFPNEDLFVTGAQDNRVRIWDHDAGQVEFILPINSKITAGKVSPDGLIIIGVSVGQCLIMSFSCLNKKIELVKVLDCRNTHGFKSAGRRITGIHFVNNTHFLVTSNDSRIRLFDANAFDIQQKYKGLKNEHSNVFATVGAGSRFVISGSENGAVFVWNLKTLTVPKLNPVFTKKKRYKNSSYETFTVSSSKTCSFAVFAPDKVVETVQRRYNSVQKNVVIQSVILVFQQGVILIFYNKIPTTKRGSS